MYGNHHKHLSDTDYNKPSEPKKSRTDDYYPLDDGQRGGVLSQHHTDNTQYGIETSYGRLDSGFQQTSKPSVSYREGVKTYGQKNEYGHTSQDQKVSALDSRTPYQQNVDATSGKQAGTADSNSSDHSVIRQRMLRQLHQVNSALQKRETQHQNQSSDQNYHSDVISKSNFKDSYSQDHSSNKQMFQAQPTFKPGLDGSSSYSKGTLYENYNPQNKKSLFGVNQSSGLAANKQRVQEAYQPKKDGSHYNNQSSYNDSNQYQESSQYKDITNSGSSVEKKRLQTGGPYEYGQGAKEYSHHLDKNKEHETVQPTKSESQYYDQSYKKFNFHHGYMYSDYSLQSSGDRDICKPGKQLDQQKMQSENRKDVNKQRGQQTFQTKKDEIPHSEVSLYQNYDPCNQKGLPYDYSYYPGWHSEDQGQQNAEQLGYSGDTGWHSEDQGQQNAKQLEYSGDSQYSQLPNKQKAPQRVQPKKGENQYSHESYYNYDTGSQYSQLPNKQKASQREQPKKGENQYSHKSYYNYDTGSQQTSQYEDTYQGHQFEKPRNQSHKLSENRKAGGQSSQSPIKQGEQQTFHTKMDEDRYSHRSSYNYYDPYDQPSSQYEDFYKPDKSNVKQTAPHEKQFEHRQDNRQRTVTPQNVSTHSFTKTDRSYADSRMKATKEPHLDIAPEGSEINLDLLQKAKLAVDELIGKVVKPSEKQNFEGNSYNVSSHLSGNIGKGNSKSSSEISSEKESAVNYALQILAKSGLASKTMTVEQEKDSNEKHSEFHTTAFYPNTQDHPLDTYDYPGEMQNTASRERYQGSAPKSRKSQHFRKEFQQDPTEEWQSPFGSQKVTSNFSRSNSLLEDPYVGKLSNFKTEFDSQNYDYQHMDTVKTPFMSGGKYKSPSSLLGPESDPTDYPTDYMTGQIENRSGRKVVPQMSSRSNCGSELHRPSHANKTNDKQIHVGLIRSNTISMFGQFLQKFPNTSNPIDTMYAALQSCGLRLEAEYFEEKLQEHGTMMTGWFTLGGVFIFRAYGRSKEQLKHLVFDSALDILRTKSIDEILSVTDIGIAAIKQEFDLVPRTESAVRSLVARMVGSEIADKLFKPEVVQRNPDIRIKERNENNSMFFTRDAFEVLQAYARSSPAAGFQFPTKFQICKLIDMSNCMLAGSYKKEFLYQSRKPQIFFRSSFFLNDALIGYGENSSHKEAMKKCMRMSLQNILEMPYEKLKMGISMNNDTDQTKVPTDEDHKMSLPEKFEELHKFSRRTSFTNNKTMIEDTDKVFKALSLRASVSYKTSQKLHNFTICDLFLDDIHIGSGESKDRILSQRDAYRNAWTTLRSSDPLHLLKNKRLLAEDTEGPGVEYLHRKRRKDPDAVLMNKSSQPKPEEKQLILFEYTKWSKNRKLFAFFIIKHSVIQSDMKFAWTAEVNTACDAGIEKKFVAHIKIDDAVAGVGYGSNKEKAKDAASLQALHSFYPTKPTIEIVVNPAEDEKNWYSYDQIIMKSRSSAPCKSDTFGAEKDGSTTQVCFDLIKDIEKEETIRQLIFAPDLPPKEKNDIVSYVKQKPQLMLETRFTKGKSYIVIYWKYLPAKVILAKVRGTKTMKHSRYRYVPKSEVPCLKSTKGAENNSSSKKSESDSQVKDHSAKKFSNSKNSSSTGSSLDSHSKDKSASNPQDNRSTRGKADSHSKGSRDLKSKDTSSAGYKSDSGSRDSGSQRYKSDMKSKDTGSTRDGSNSRSKDSGSERAKSDMPPRESGSAKSKSDSQSRDNNAEKCQSGTASRHTVSARNKSGSSSTDKGSSNLKSHSLPSKQKDETSSCTKQQSSNQDIEDVVVVLSDSELEHLSINSISCGDEEFEISDVDMSDFFVMDDVDL